MASPLDLPPTPIPDWARECARLFAQGATTEPMCERDGAVKYITTPTPDGARRAWECLRRAHGLPTDLSTRPATPTLAA